MKALFDAMEEFMCRKGRKGVLAASSSSKKKIAYRKVPSVLTLKSCKMNQIPKSFSGYVSLKAAQARLPIRFLVNIPPGCDLGSTIVSAAGGLDGSSDP